MSQQLSGAMPVPPESISAAVQAEASVPVATSGPPATPPPGLREVFAIWLLYAAVSLIILAVYASHPASVFYHFSGNGWRGAFGRMVVYLNFPFGFVALVLLGIAVARLEACRATVTPASRHGVEALAIIAVPLMLVAAWPGVVTEANLDVKAINGVPVIGLVLAATVTLAVWRLTGAGEAAPWHRLDSARLVVIAALALLGLPWIMAELGVWIADMPLFDRWFQTAGSTGGHRPIGVHLGDHHGLDGVLFVTSALILSRVLTRISTGGLRRTLAVYLGLMLVYGAANALNDFWGEQIVAPGWTRHTMPGLLEPAITPSWGIMLAIGIAVAIFLVIQVDLRVERRAAA